MIVGFEVVQNKSIVPPTLDMFDEVQWHVQWDFISESEDAHHFFFILQPSESSWLQSRVKKFNNWENSQCVISTIRKYLEVITKEHSSTFFSPKHGRRRHQLTSQSELVWRIQAFMRTHLRKHNWNSGVSMGINVGFSWPFDGPLVRLNNRGLMWFLNFVGPIVEFSHINH